MKSLSLKSFLLFSGICILGVQSTRLCLKDTDVESTGSEEQAVPKCSAAVDLLQVGIMIQRFTDRPESEIIPPWMNMTLLQEGRRFANKNFALIWFSDYIRAIISVASEEFMPWLPLMDKSASVDKVAKMILTSVSDTLGALAIDTETPVNMGNLKSILNSIAFEAEGSQMDPKKYTKVSLDESLWQAVESDLKMSSIPKEFRKFPEDLQVIKKWQVPLNQFSLALGQYSLFGLPLSMKNISALLNATDEEGKGWLHLWAVLGHIMGIEDNFNVALQRNIEEATEYSRQLVNTYLVPSFFKLKLQHKVLIEALLKVSSALLPVEGFNLSPRLNMNIFMEEFLGIETPKTRALLSEKERDNLEIWEDMKSSLTINPFLLESLNQEMRHKIVDTNYLTKYVYTK